MVSSIPARMYGWRRFFPLPHLLLLVGSSNSILRIRRRIFLFLEGSSNTIIPSHRRQA